MTRRTLAAAAVTVFIACASAPPVSAATKTVDVGGHGFKGAPKNLQALAFLRSVVSVHVGDSVRFKIQGGLIHTATFVPRGQPIPSLATLDPAHPVSGVTDANGKPFWFNGQPRPILNPIAAVPTARNSVTGRAFVNSGIPSDQAKGMTFRVTFPKAGTFKFVCLVHPGMFGIGEGRAALGSTSLRALRTRPPPSASVAAIVKAGQRQGEAPRSRRAGRRRTHRSPN